MPRENLATEHPPLYVRNMLELSLTGHSIPVHIVDEIDETQDEDGNPSLDAISCHVD